LRRICPNDTALTCALQRRMQNLFLLIAIFAFSALALCTAPDAGARGRGGGHGGGTRSGSSHHSHNHHRTFVGGAFFFGGPPYPWPYYGYPVPTPYEMPPTVVYVERYDGTPTPETQDWIFCPNTGASYPEVQECPGGWQRVIENPQLPPDPAT
jgi:hypothetical protein